MAALPSGFAKLQEDRIVELIKYGVNEGEILREEKQKPLEAKLKEDIKQEIGTLYAQTQVLLESAMEEQANSKEHNAFMTDYVNLKHKEITAIGDEVAKLKESNAQLDALTQAKDASIWALMFEQKAEIDDKFHKHDVSLQTTISSGRDEFQRLHQALDL